MQVQAVEGENVLEVSGEEIPSLELADQIAVCKQVPIMEPSSMSVDTSSMTVSMSAHQPQHEMEDSGLEHGDIVQDAQFFQDAAIEYQMAYQSLEDKYTHQAVLMKEASEALKASESHVSAMQEELMTLKHSHEADIQRLLATWFCNMSISFLQCNLALTITNQLLHSCRSRSRCSKSHWLVRGICLLWVHPKGRWISRKRYLTSSQGWSTPTGVLQSIIHLTNHFNSKNRFDSGTGLTSLIWSWMLSLVWVLNLSHFHLMPLCLSMGQVRYC